MVSTIAPVLFDSAISSMPRMRACRFSSVVSAGEAGKLVGKQFGKDLHRRLDRDLVIAHAQARHHVARVVEAHFSV